MAAPALHELSVFDDDGRVRAVIEATAGTRSKLKWSKTHLAFELHHSVPSGTAFPRDFGFVPSTAGEDGDPLDALVFCDEPLPAGTVVPCSAIGVLHARQSEPGKPPVRNDRFLLVAAASHEYAHWKDIAEVPAKLLDELEAFFVSYNAQRG